MLIGILAVTAMISAIAHRLRTYVLKGFVTQHLHARGVGVAGRLYVVEFRDKSLERMLYANEVRPDSNNDDEFIPLAHDMLAVGGPRYLLCSDYPLSDKALCVIGRMKNLRFLSIAGAGVTDQGIMRLKDSGLTDLALYDTRITDACIPTLSSMHTLRDITLIRSGISCNGLAALRKATPACLIDSDACDRLSSFPPEK